MADAAGTRPDSPEREKPMENPSKRRRLRAAATCRRLWQRTRWQQWEDDIDSDGESHEKGSQSEGATDIQSNKNEKHVEDAPEQPPRIDVSVKKVEHLQKFGKDEAEVVEDKGAGGIVTDGTEQSVANSVNMTRKELDDLLIDTAGKTAKATQNFMLSQMEDVAMKREAEVARLNEEVAMAKKETEVQLQCLTKTLENMATKMSDMEARLEERKRATEENEDHNLMVEDAFDEQLNTLNIQATCGLDLDDMQRSCRLGCLSY